jgi:hypothetical protein
MDSIPLIFLAIGAVGGFLAFQGGRMIRRRINGFNRTRKLVAAYGEETGRKIADGKLWVGMTERQVEASQGKPSEIKEKNFTRKGGADYTRETWSYKAPGESHIALRIYLEDGKVVSFKD